MAHSVLCPPGEPFIKPSSHRVALKTSKPYFHMASQFVVAAIMAPQKTTHILSPTEVSVASFVSSPNAGVVEQ